MERGGPTDTKILLVDDEPAIQRVVARHLKPGGITVVSALTCAEARGALDRHEFSLVLLDIKLPDCNGLEFCEEICRSRRVPVVMLTVSADEDDVVRALAAGADDYLRKPFGGRELRARVEAVLRRWAASEDPLASTIEVGPLSLDPRNYRATIAGETLSLSPTEYKVLAFLVQNVGRVITHDELLRGVWGDGYDGEYHMLHVTMSRLQQKLTALSSGVTLIRNTPGVGYQLLTNGSR